MIKNIKHEKQNLRFKAKESQRTLVDGVVKFTMLHFFIRKTCLLKNISYICLINKLLHS